MKTILKSTGETVHPLPSLKSNNADWPTGYQRILIPNPHGKHRIEVVRNSTIKRIKTSITEQE